MVTRRTVLTRLAVAGGTVATGSVAGCLSGGGGAPADTPAGDGGTDDGSTVRVSSHREYGDILVDGEGMVLYLFTKDEGGESVCYDDCASSWPPLTVEGEPTAGDGVTAEVGTTERDDGAMQVTAAGNPLYYFANDENPGDANGQGIGDVWYVVAPDGSKVTGASSGGGDSYY